MAIGFVAIRDSTHGGVYYCANFTTSGAITWSKLTTTGLSSLVIDEFKVDPYDPLNRQYVLADNVLYGRNGGNWSSLITLAQARTLTGWSSANDQIKSVWCDPVNAGYVYVVYNGNTIGTGESAILKSTNYGSTWAVSSLPSTNRQFFDLQIYGSTVWLTHDPSAISNPRIYYSTNGGSTYVNATSLARGIMVRYPHNTAQCLGRGPSALGATNYDLYYWNATPAATKLQDDLAEGTANNYADSQWATGEAMWIDPYTSGHERLLRDWAVGPTIPLCYTSDGWATYSTTTVTLSGGTDGIATQVTHLYNTSTTTAVVFAINGETSGAYRSCIYALDSEADTSASLRNGANSETTYVDSVPSNLTLAYRTPIWVGSQVVGKGVYVYSVEEESGDDDWATDISDYDGLGSPMGGDRSSFRDLPSDGFDVYHAQDVHAGTPQIHAPWDETSPPGVGYGIISDGTKWEVSSDEIALDSDLHDAVTLDVDAAVVLDLNGQEIGLDVQAANTVFAGPTTGAANEPTFRALVEADIDEILPLAKLSDVDTAGVGTGDIIYKSSGDWVDYPLGIGTAIANDGGSIKIGDLTNGNYFQVSSDGEVTLTGDATAWEDLRVEPTVRAAAGAGVPAFEKYFDDTPGTSKGVYLYSFTDEAVAGNEKEVFFTMQMPHAWKVGSDISFHVHFVPSATVASSDIIWGLEYTWKGIGEVFGDTVIVYSSTTLLPDDANITAGKHYLAEFTDLAPGTTASSLSSILIGRLFRNSSAGGDTYTNKVGLLYIDAHYQVDSFGSYDEYSKEVTLADSDGIVLTDSDGTELVDSAG